MVTRFLFVTRDDAGEYTNDMFECHTARTDYLWLRDHVRAGCPVGSHVDLYRVEYNDEGVAIHYSEPLRICEASGKLRENAIQRMMDDMGWDRSRAAVEYDTDGSQRFYVPGYGF